MSQELLCRAGAQSFLHAAQDLNELSEEAAEGFDCAGKRTAHTGLVGTAGLRAGEAQGSKDSLQVGSQIDEPLSGENEQVHNGFALPVEGGEVG